MILGRGRWVVVLVVISVLMIFLFPAMHGPYSVVNGPATALQAARAANRLLTPIVHSARRYSGNSLISAFIVLAWMSLPEAGFQAVTLHDCNTILRC
jgi:hypothetical protein